MPQYTMLTRNAIEAAMSLAVLGAVGCVAAFPYIELLRAGMQADRLLLAALAASVPAALALVAAKGGQDPLSGRATRFLYPTCAALLSSCLVSVPIYLMGPAIA